MKIEKCNLLNINESIQVDNTLEPTMNWIKTDNDPILRKKSTKVEFLDKNILENINRMVSYIDASYNKKEKLYKIKPGIAIAAPQVGLNKRIIYVHFAEEDTEYRYLLINPEIISFSEASSFIENGEGCLSVKNDVSGNIQRHYKIIVKAFDLLQNKEVEIVAKDLLSICLQHEIDHLDGILYPDHINKENPFYFEKDWIKF